MKLKKFFKGRKGAEIIEMIFGVVIAGVVCVVAYNGVKGIVDSTLKQANNAFNAGTQIQAPSAGEITVPGYGGATIVPDAQDGHDSDREDAALPQGPGEEAMGGGHSSGLPEAPETHDSQL